MNTRIFRTEISQMSSEKKTEWILNAITEIERLEDELKVCRRQILKLDKKNKYVYYLLGYCYYNEYFDGLGSDIGIEIEQCIIYVQMGGALPINCLCAMYYAHSGTISEHLILSLLELLPNELINKFYKITSLDVFSEQLVSFHQFITKVYINRTNYLQNKVNEMEIKLVNLMHQHEEEIKELLTPGNKGALAAESRFKEIVTVTDKSDGLDSLDE